MTTNQWKSKAINSQSNEIQTPNNSSIFWLVGAFVSALVATFCCLPALLFLLFGSSFGLLAILGPLEKYRVVLSVLALLCFVIFIWARFYRASCELNRGLRGRSLVLVLIAFFALSLLLFYPEIIGAFYLYE